VPTISLRHSVGVCGLHAPLSVLNDVMLYGAFRTKSLKSVLKQMAGLCSTNASEPDALLTVAGKATITAVAPADPGLDHTIELDLTLTNPGGKTVDIHNASLILADSGGYPLMRFGLFGQNTIFENSSPPIGAGGSFAGSKIFGWGGNPFHFIVSIHASDSGGKRQHLIRHVPILRSGFAAPQNLAVPGPVYVGLWERPVEIVNLLHNGAPTQWLTAGGQIVNVARSQVKITIDSLSFALLSENGDEQDLFAQNWFYDQNGKLLTPNPDGRVPFFAFAANFVFGFPVTVKGAKPTLPVDLLYTIDDQGKTSQGKATTVLPVSVVTPAIVASPLRTPKNVNWDWNWGNAPDHTTWTDQNGSPTGFDSHANFGEHYCYDITGIDSSTNRSFAGIAAEAALDGFYVVRTNLPKRVLGDAATVGAYSVPVAQDRRTLSNAQLSQASSPNRPLDSTKTQDFMCQIDWASLDRLYRLSRERRHIAAPPPAYGKCLRALPF
jgi:hypothetical protein